MARANVKINTAKVLDLLRDKAKEIAKQLAELPALEKKHKEAVEAWKKKVIASIPKTQKATEVEIKTPTWGENAGKVVVEITYVIPTNKVGERPQDNTPSSYSLKNKLSELEQTIKLLELTDDQQVSATTYRNLADLL